MESFRQTIAISLFAVAFTALNPSHSSGQDTTNQQQEYKNSTIVLPAVGSSPETSLLLGGVAIMQFKPDKANADTRPSSILASGIYTLKNQLSFSFAPTLFLSDERWIMSGGYSYSYFPETFWGVGAFSRESDEMTMSYRQIYLEQSALREISDKVFAGPQLRWTKSYSVSYEDSDGADIAPPQLTGAEDYSTAGIGLSIRWDRRNSLITPTRNHMVGLSIMTHPSWLGTLDAYTSYLFDARKYYPLSPESDQSVLAFQLLTRLSSGNPPFKDMAMLGGENVLRGYYGGRFRDRHGAQFQTEVRQHVYGRLGVALFGAAGQVWHSFNQMHLDRTRLAAGGGLRFNLNKVDPTNIRIDYAVGKNTSGLYLTIGEAF